MIDHISFSSLINWYTCPYYFKLLSDGLKTPSNAFFAFGKTIHSICENKVKGIVLNYEEYFDEQFATNLCEVEKNILLDSKQLIS